MAKSGPLRWGIVSAGKISSDFVVALSTLHSTEHTVNAIAARSMERAQKFAATYNIPKFYDNYDKLALDKNVDVVYIGAINTEHKAITMQMLRHGKHVLCEKPMCLNVKDTKELCDYAKENHLFLMEAIWSRFFPSYIEMKRMIHDNEIGDVIQVNANFGVPIADVDRVNSGEDSIRIETLAYN